MYANFGNPQPKMTIAQALRVPGPARTSIFTIAGATLAFALSKGSKQKRQQSLFFGAGAGALLAIFLEP